MKGQFYSLIALLIAAPIFVFTINYISYAQTQSYSIADRVISDQLHQLVNSIEIDTKKVIEVSARRALLGATNYIISEGVPLNDAVENLTELMLTGYINGTKSIMMINNTIPNWSQRISSQPVNFDVTLEYGNISIENYDGYSLRIGMDINLSVKDKLDIASIVKTNQRKYVIITVEGLEDPFFPLNTFGFLRRVISRPDNHYFSKKIFTGSANSSGSCEGEVTFNKSIDDNSRILAANNDTDISYPYHLGVILEENRNISLATSCSITGNSSSVTLINNTIIDLDYAKIYIDEGTKAAWIMPSVPILDQRKYYQGNGPDYLMRLEGNYSPSSNGLITFIYPPELEQQAFSVKGYSRIAYLYFSQTGSCNTVRNTPGWFGLDNSHATDLNVSCLLTTDPCYTWEP